MRNFYFLFNRYKDGIPYPWLGGGSSFILDPVTLNQTIYTGTVRESDAGQYRCVVRNDTHSLSHTISLTVLGELLHYDNMPFYINFANFFHIL